MSLPYLKTVTANDLFIAQNNSTLALPREEHISTLSRVVSEKRVNDQVRLALLQKLKYQDGTHGTEIQNSHLTANHRGTSNHAATLPHVNFHSQSSDQKRWNTTNGMVGLENEFSQMRVTKDMKQRRDFSTFSNRGYRSLSQRKHAGRPSLYSDNEVFAPQLSASRSEPDLLNAQRSPTMRRTIQKRKSQLYSRHYGTSHKVVQNNRTLPASMYRTYNEQRQSMQCGSMPVPQPQKPSPNMFVDMNLEKAVSLLSNGNPAVLAYAASYIQHECYSKESAKLEVYKYMGIPRLIKLLKIPNANIQQAVCGALRNAVFKNNTNKLEVVKHGGIAEVLQLLEQTSDKETRDQITGLLWNLSSNEDLKGSLMHAIPILNKSVIIPYVSELPISKDYEAFHNATGCLRNLSCAGPEVRQQMRSAPAFIDSIMDYVQTRVSTNTADEKPVENCVCILHNLSYQLNKEAPEDFNTILGNGNIQDVGSKRYPRKSSSNSISPSCFKPGDDPDDVICENVIHEDDNPKGVGRLLHSKSVKMYSDLMSKSTSDSTLEACCGALLNLTANNERTSQWMSSLLVNKNNALPHVVKLLGSKNTDVQKTAVSLLSNVSRHKSLQPQLASQALPFVTRLLSSSSFTSTASDSTVSSACNIMRNAVLSNPKMAKPLLQGGFLKSLMAITTSGKSPLAAKTAGNFLSEMWQMKDLHGLLKREGVSKDLVNGFTKNFSQRSGNMISNSFFG